MMQIELFGCLVGEIHDARGGDADGHRDRVTDLLLRATKLERLLDVPFETAFAFRDQ